MLAQTRQTLRQIAQRRQRMHGQEVVDVRQRGLDAARERIVVGDAQQRVEPDQAAAAAALEAGDLGAEEIDVAQSQPSLMTSVIAPRPRTRRAQSKLKACSASPMRVPPDQSGTTRETSASARSRSRSRSCRLLAELLGQRRDAGEENIWLWWMLFWRHATHRD